MVDLLRVRLTIWYVAVLGTVLVAFSTGAYILLERNLHARMDAAVRSTLDLATASLWHRGSTARDEVAAALAELHTPNQAIAVLGSAGQLLGEKPTVGNLPVRLPHPALPASEAVSFYSLPEHTDESDDSCRGVVQRLRLTGSETPYLVVVNQSLEPISDRLDWLQDFFWVTVPLTLALAGLGGWLLARRSLAPVVQMSESARRISAENLDQRLPIANPRDELGHLAATFNELLARLSNSFAQ